MADLLKDQFFTRDSLDAMMTVLSKHFPELNTEMFKKLIYDSEWKNRELKQKMRHVTQCMHKGLPDSFDESVEILLIAAPELTGWESMTLPDYIEVYGQKYWEKSMSALTEFTKHSSSEFATRPFLINEPEKTVAFLKGLTDDENDESEYERRSVANNLNDISKDNPDTVLEIAEQWYGKTPKTDWLVKHACRTLLKEGTRRALVLLSKFELSGSVPLL